MNTSTILIPLIIIFITILYLKKETTRDIKVHFAIAGILLMPIYLAYIEVPFSGPEKIRILESIAISLLSIGAYLFTAIFFLPLSIKGNKRIEELRIEMDTVIKAIKTLAKYQLLFLLACTFFILCKTSLEIALIEKDIPDSLEGMAIITTTFFPITLIISTIFGVMKARLLQGD